MTTTTPTTHATAILTREIAGKLGDALGISQHAFRCVITLDWQTDKFEIVTQSYITNEQGQLVVKVIESEPTPEFWELRDKDQQAKT